jgi:hypothetical protein
MRSVILYSQTIATAGGSRQVLKSREDMTRATGLRGMRLFLEHSRETCADHPRSDKPAQIVAVPGAACLSEPRGSGNSGPRRCWQARRLLASRVYAGSR